MTVQPSPPAAVVHSGKYEILVRRRIKIGREADYLAAMREFVSYALSCPGYESISVLSPAPGEREYAVLGSFTDEAARRRFTATPEYAVWMTRLAEFTDGEVGFVERNVLNEWVRPPALAASAAVPPKWRTATATFAGVFPVVTLLNFTLTPVLRPWPIVASSAVIAAIVVILLTWLVMPVVSRLLRPWLYPAPAAADRAQSI